MLKKIITSGIITLFICLAAGIVYADDSILPDTGMTASDIFDSDISDADVSDEEIIAGEGIQAEDLYVHDEADPNDGEGQGEDHGADLYDGQTGNEDISDEKSEITDAVLKYSSLIYTGKKRTQSKTTEVYSGETLLEGGKDYSIRYSDNTEAGTATMTITGKGSYTGTIIRTFEITRAPIQSVSIKYLRLTYNGRKRTQTNTAIVKCRSKVLEKNKDYSVSYQNNRNAGIATMIVKGKGNYTGTIKRRFRILKAPIESAELRSVSRKYTGNRLRPLVIVQGRSCGQLVTLKKNVDYTVTYKNNVNPGTASVTVVGKGNYKGTLKRTFKIRPIPISALSAGDIVDNAMIKGIEKQYFRSSVISYGDKIFNYINGKSYYDNPDIALSDLRYVKVLHYNFDHEIQVGELIVNKRIKNDVLHIFRELFDAGYEINSMYLIDRFWTGDPESSDNESCDANNSSGFCYRRATGSADLSRHAYGMAIDINTRQNPYVWYENGVQTCYHRNARAYIDRSGSDPHMIKKGDICYNIFTKYGFQWGGERLDPIDYQHFEK